VTLLGPTTPCYISLYESLVHKYPKCTTCCVTFTPTPRIAGLNSTRRCISGFFCVALCCVRRERARDFPLKGSCNRTQGSTTRNSDWLRAGRPSDRSSSPGRVKIFFLFKSCRPVLEATQPLIQWVTRAILPGVKRPDCESDHSPQTSAKVKNTWIYISTPPYVFMA
jgi:hypothetical protein